MGCLQRSIFFFCVSFVNIFNRKWIFPRFKYIIGFFFYMSLTAVDRKTREREKEQNSIDNFSFVFSLSRDQSLYPITSYSFPFFFFFLSTIESMVVLEIRKWTISFYFISLLIFFFFFAKDKTHEWNLSIWRKSLNAKHRVNISNDILVCEAKV